MPRTYSPNTFTFMIDFIIRLYTLFLCLLVLFASWSFYCSPKLLCINHRTQYSITVPPSSSQSKVGSAVSCTRHSTLTKFRNITLRHCHLSYVVCSYSGTLIPQLHSKPRIIYIFGTNWFLL